MGRLSRSSTSAASGTSPAACVWMLRSAKLWIMMPPARTMWSIVRAGSRSRRPSVAFRYTNRAPRFSRDLDWLSSSAAAMFRRASPVRVEPSVATSAMCSRQVELSVNAW
jgi:hypothetical protein